MKVKKWDAFDNLVFQITMGNKWGKPLGNYYQNHEWFRKLIKFGATTIVMFWFVKGPLIFLLTEVLGWWYILSAFLVGLIVTVVGFLVNHFMGVIEWEGGEK